MCRSTEYPGFQARREALKIQAFFIRFSGLDSHKPLPESLTLSYLPRINGTALEIDGSKIRPDAPAFVTLHRSVNAKVRKGEAIFGSREAVRAGDGVQFEAYLREEKVLKGIFRKDVGQEWKLECKCVLEVCVAVEGHVAMSERVAMIVKRRGKCGFHPLEEIPEVDEEWDGGCCCTCGEMDGGDLEEDGDVEEELDMDVDVEGVRWAVDVGFWVMCLGVGYLVSKASSKSLRRRRLF
ncbi:uncharacterized protein LOC112177091 isoform X2 [Rosa chinensis]|uniref:uncharacterized protein LOC112177091 isoform X2 n=1 Tax=Rosa chinensis TaxID=74649 RepID=UPI001AD8AEB7|nr:uncharacterized protein LOC112177091 isoform X2 [Rosa chinensis]